MSGRKAGYSPLNTENSRGVTHGFMFAYAREKISILLSVLSILFFLFFIILTWIHKVLYTYNLSGINWASIETCKFSRNAMNAYLLYWCSIYRHVKVFFLYRNKSYIFPILRLAKIGYWSPYCYHKWFFFILLVICTTVVPLMVGF